MMGVSLTPSVTETSKRRTTPRQGTAQIRSAGIAVSDGFRICTATTVSVNYAFICHHPQWVVAVVLRDFANVHCTFASRAAYAALGVVAVFCHHVFILVCCAPVWWQCSHRPRCGCHEGCTSYLFFYSAQPVRLLRRSPWHAPSIRLRLAFLKTLNFSAKALKA